MNIELGPKLKTFLNLPFLYTWMFIYPSLLADNSGHSLAHKLHRDSISDTFLKGP